MIRWTLTHIIIGLTHNKNKPNRKPWWQITCLLIRYGNKIMGGGAWNNGKTHLITTENYSDSLHVPGLTIGLFMSTPVNYVPQNNFKNKITEIVLN